MAENDLDETEMDFCPDVSALECMEELYLVQAAGLLDEVRLLDIGVVHDVACAFSVLEQVPGVAEIVYERSATMRGYGTSRCLPAVQASPAVDVDGVGMDEECHLLGEQLGDAELVYELGAIMRGYGISRCLPAVQTRPAVVADVMNAEYRYLSEEVMVAAVVAPEVGRDRCEEAVRGPTPVVHPSGSFIFAKAVSDEGGSAQDFRRWPRFRERLLL